MGQVTVLYPIDGWATIHQYKEMNYFVRNRMDECENKRAEWKKLGRKAY